MQAQCKLSQDARRKTPGRRTQAAICTADEERCRESSPSAHQRTKSQEAGAERETTLFLRSCRHANCLDAFCIGIVDTGESVRRGENEARTSIQTLPLRPSSMVSRESASVKVAVRTTCGIVPGQPRRRQSASVLSATFPLSLEASHQ